MDKENQGDLLTVKQAAERAGLGETAIRNAIKRGKLKATEAFGVIVVSTPDVDAYIATAKVGRPKKDDAPGA